MRFKRAAIVGLVVGAGALAGGSAGVALSGGTGDEVNGAALSASDCPDIAAEFERRDLPVPTIGGEQCPSMEEIEQELPTYERDVERMREVVGDDWGRDR